MSESNGSKQKWLKKAYKHFAEYGPENLSILKISKEINLLRTTFYYHFADKEDLIEQLLIMHYKETDSYVAAFKEHCKVLIPDLHNLLEQIQTAIKFHRQLFVNRHIPNYNMVYMRVNDTTNKVEVPLFIRYYKFDVHYEVAEDLWTTLKDTWYANINVNDLSAAAMIKVTENIMKNILAFVGTKLFVEIQEPKK
ncbi:MAG: TetR/AcrR family transcriptional regulator [Bacteroidota bacterium]|nr:TetR/AcrR family transcriptional regulator [Bacteroidota bacterium]